MTTVLTNKQKFINHLNTAIESEEIEVMERQKEGGGNSGVFSVFLKNNDFENTVLTPSEDLRTVMSDESLLCFGKELNFNNDNTSFWPS
jgi:hypothetical protein